MSFRTAVTGLVAIAALLGSGTTLAQKDDVDLSQDHPKAFIKDSVITTKVKTKLASEHLSSLSKIHVDTDANGVVWLSGTAPTRQAADRAAEVAHSIEGVVGVKNKIQVSGE
jgi:hyperosmotically inducible periplasmic protein